LIVGIVHPCSRETVVGSANSFGTTGPVGRIARINPAQNEIAPTARCRVESASTPQRTAITAGQRLLSSPLPEVMHPKSISRELAQENDNRPGIA
jgi:hypothetical protein